MNIKPIALKSRREYMGFSQQDLADESKLSPATIKRIEAGRGPKKSSSRTIKLLAKALKIDPEVLLGVKEPPKVTENSDKPISRQMETDHRTQLKFDLVTSRYGIKHKDVLEIMPVAFVLFAEEILRIRRDNLKKIVDLFDTKNLPRHYAAFAEGPDVEEFIQTERESIKRCDLFAELFEEHKTYGDWYGSWKGNPVSELIRKKAQEILSDIPEKAEEIILFDSKDEDPNDPSYLPEMDLLEGEFDKISHGSSLCKVALRQGEISVNEIPNFAENDQIRFEAWLRDKAPTSAEFQDRMDAIIQDFEI